MKFLIGGTPTGTLAHISAEEYRLRCGMLTSWRDRANPVHALKLGAAWAVDNYGYRPDMFKPHLFRGCLKDWQGIPGCLFAVAPDTWGNAADTYQKFEAWGGFIRDLGYPVALAVQDGMEALPVNWASFDALFLGGSDPFRAGAFVAELVLEARLRRKWVHMGRVNSRERWRFAARMGFDSCDGSGMVIERKRVLEALAVLNHPETPFWDWKPTIESGTGKEATLCP